MFIEVVRDSFTEKSSVGKLFIDGTYFCETLEDAARAYGVKIAGKTAIPAGQYFLTITPSQRFNRPMILLYTDKTDLSCKLGDVKFTGVRIHGGNTAENTEGCILAARVRDSADRIHGTMETALFTRVKNAIDSGDKVGLKITNRQA